MRRSQMLGLLCLATCLMLANSAMAQGQGGRGRGGRGGFGGGMMGAAMLLGNEKVQDELKLTSEQKEKLTALREEGGGGRRGRGGNQGSDEDREKAMAEFRKRMEESNKKAEAVLDAGQLKRFKEISLQARGNGALADEEIAAALKLTDDQKEMVKTISEESGKRMGELRDSADREERQKKFAELRKDTDEEYLAVLTDEQKAKFAEMKGAKVDIDFAAGFGGRGNGGRRRGGNNN